MVMWLTRGFVLLPLLTACSNKGTDGPEAPAAAGSQTSPRALAAALWAGRTIVVGHAAARFKFAIPAGLAPLRGVTPPPDPREAVELANQGADGVGIADGAFQTMNSIVVFSDPEGIGTAFDAMDDAARAKLAAAYVQHLRAKVPDARDAELVKVGAHLAWRVEFPKVVMEGRPLRRGRHYLLFDQMATASVDCLWTDPEAAGMAAACDAAAAGLERVSRGP